MLRRKILTALALCVFLGFSTFTNADTTQGTTTTFDTTTTPMISDQDLTKTIQDHLKSGFFTTGYENVKVNVNNGVVTIFGEVKTLSDKAKVESDIGAMKGVKSVNSKLTVAGSTNDAFNDTGSTSGDQ